MATATDPNNIDFNNPTLKALTGPQRDAYAALTVLFNSYNLGTLTPVILKYLQQGFSSDTITVLLQQTNEYKTRFAGNQARISNGLAVLTPAEYLSTEAAYRQLLIAYGMDPVFQHKDQYAYWIGHDVSPAELQTRVQLTAQAVETAPPSLTNAFTRLGFNRKDLVDYFMNDQNPTPKLQMKMSQAQIIAAADQQGLMTGNPHETQSQWQARMMKYAEQGVTYDQAQLAYQQIAHTLPRANELTQIYGMYPGHQIPGYTTVPGVDQMSLEEEFLGKSGTAQLAREQLGRMEQANFQGTGGVNEKSFTQPFTGQAR